MSLRCWWFGCDIHPQDPAPVEHATCMHCGESVSYSDMVGDTRHYRLVSFVKAVIPNWRKCPSCGGRFKCDEAIDHIPF